MQFAQPPYKCEIFLDIGIGKYLVFLSWKARNTIRD